MATTDKTKAKHLFFRNIRSQSRRDRKGGKAPAPGAIRVVRIIARLNVGGPAFHVAHLTEGLDGDYPTLLVTGRVGEDEAEIDIGRIAPAARVRYIPELGRSLRPWDDLVALVKLVRLLRRIRPEIVHTHTAKAGTLGRIAAVLARVPVRVHTFHGHVFQGYFSPLATRAVLAIERFLARFTTRIVTLSPRLAAELAEVYRICPAEQIEAVPLGLKLERFALDQDRLRRSFREEIGAGERPVVTIVGRLVPIKNHDLFVDVAARFEAAGRAGLFVVAGGGGEESRLRARVAAEGLEDRVRFLGWREDLERIYAGSDVVALTSNNEGTPVCLIEAMAAGRRVAATDVGGVRDLLDAAWAGTVVPAGDPEAMYLTIAKLLEDHEFITLAKERAAAVRAEYGVERLLQDIRNLYGRLSPLSRSSPGPTG